MKTISIGIVEDEMVIASLLELTLGKLGYHVSFIAQNYSSAVAFIKEKQPDLLLLDINLSGQKDGIDVAHYVRTNHDMSIIFLTANSDAVTLARAKEVKPNAYLLKPFSKDSLYAAIEIAAADPVMSASRNLSIMVKSGYHYVKVFLSEIRYVGSDQNYVTLYLKNHEKVMVRSTLAEMHARLGEKLFFKINRGYLVNIQQVTDIKTDCVLLGQDEFPITKNQRDALLELLGKKQAIRNI
jgi:DNA-binding LytR/AlgR family response regulator